MRRGNHSTQGASNRGARLTLISKLRPNRDFHSFFQQIRARVIKIHDIISGNKGQFFHIDLLDASGEIRCTGFENHLTTLIYERLREDTVYYFSKFKIEPARKQKNDLPRKYEMKMTRGTAVERCRDDEDVPTLSFDFVPLSNLIRYQENSLVDAIVVCKECGGIKSGKKKPKRRVLLVVDHSGLAVNLTLWGDESKSFDGRDFPILALKRVRVIDDNGLALSAGKDTIVRVNPPALAKAKRLWEWFERAKERDFQFKALDLKDFGQAVVENPGREDKVEYFQAFGTLFDFLRKDCLYKACSASGCKKKVVELGNGLYHCDKCDTDDDDYEWRLILSATVADYSRREENVFCPGNIAEALLGEEREELVFLAEHDALAYDSLMEEAQFKRYMFKMRVKKETYKEEERRSLECLKATPINWSEYGRHLIGQLEEMNIYI